MLLMSIEFTIDGDEQIATMREHFDVWFSSRAHLDVADGIAEDARIRVEDETTGPNGERWDPWSPAYADTRGPQHKLLFSTGALADSILAQAQGVKSVVGSDLPYAIRQHNARPYVGLSPEVVSAANDFLPASFERGWRAFA